MRNQLAPRHSDPLWNLMFGGVNDFETRRHIPYDVKETDEKFLLAMDLPGIRNEDLKVDLLENVLSISGERKAVFGQPEEARKFSFKFTMPERSNLAGLEARLEDGVLQVSVPKREEEKARSIPVSSGKAS